MKLIWLVFYLILIPPSFYEGTVLRVIDGDTLKQYQVSSIKKKVQRIRSQEPRKKAL
jgi:hypothetical protein